VRKKGRRSRAKNTAAGDKNYIGGRRRTGLTDSFNLTIASQFQDTAENTVHTWEVALRESRHRPPQRTNLPCRAHEAHAPLFAAAGALACANEHAGAAAPPAPYHAGAARQRAWSFSALSHPRGEEA
jgi:hypothetical protein